jgi:hypothetical protein
MDHVKCKKESQSLQNEPCNTGSLVDSPGYGGCHMEEGTASHVLCESAALAEFRFRHEVKHFYGTKRL